MMLFRISVQWCVEPFIAHPICSSHHALAIDYQFALTTPEHDKAMRHEKFIS